MIAAIETNMRRRSMAPFILKQLSQLKMNRSQILTRLFVVVVVVAIIINQIDFD
jgi:hypothetical protein